jgi:serine/threonine-protein kinase
VTPDRHERLMTHFDEACRLAPEAQAAYLRRLAAEDAALARELTELLAHDRAAGDTLERAVHADLGSAPTRPLSGGASSSADLEGVPDLEPIAALGEGGMGRVLLARQRSLRREVAVKVASDASEERADALLAEAVLAGSLEHPNIVPVHVLERDRGGRPVLVMKRVEGVSWDTLIRAPAHAAWAPLLKSHGDRLAAHLWILNAVCHALHFAHSRGVVHRDVKPDNVMVGAFGEVYLVDWGIAARTAEPSAGAPLVIGTPGFVGPEMLAEGASQVDVRSDVYLLGATLHYALVGKPRHEGATVFEQLAAARSSLPCAYPPEVPEELAAICNRATHRDPAQRFATAEAFREAIGDYQRHRGAQALSEAAWQRLDRLVELVAAGARAEPRRVHELASESQFGFQQSLRAWPDNTRARDGLRRCLRTQVAYEVGQENLGRAQALLDELDEPAPELAASVAALRERVQAREAREAKLAALERAQDWRVAARHRGAFFVLACALSIGLWRLAVRDPDPQPLTPEALALYTVVAFGAMGALAAVFRRHLFATDVTRHVVVGALCCIAAMAANRAAHAISAPPTAAILSGDMLLAALGAALGAVTLARWFWILVPIFAGGALAARLAPDLAGATFALGATLALAIGLVASSPRKR